MKFKTGPRPRTLEQGVRYVLHKAERTESGCLEFKVGRKIGIGYHVLRAADKSWYAHRLIFYAATGLLPEVVMHKCDNPCCVELEHLQAGTHTENVADKVQKRRHNHGTNHYRTKLTPKEVEKIRASTESYAALAEKYCISRGGIHNIKSGRSWKLS